MGHLWPSTRRFHNADSAVGCRRILDPSRDAEHHCTPACRTKPRRPGHRQQVRGIESQPSSRYRVSTVIMKIALTPFYGASGFRVGVSTRGAVATGPRLRGAVRLSLWLWERGNVAVSATFPRFHSPGTAAAWFHLRLGGRRSGRRISHIRGTRFAPSAEITHPKPGRAHFTGSELRAW